MLTPPSKFEECGCVTHPQSERGMIAWRIATPCSQHGPGSRGWGYPYRYTMPDGSNPPGIVEAGKEDEYRWSPGLLNL